ncbi:class I SAM-dependent methyltransferase [Gordonia sp. X0973]|uniref:class I SAM-dependent methyltransferase n=1 Tax=Gordonia sp. X0973 TaxID=2742602 RepID=UPI000F535CB6|nr:class I SAM-dependent methyltransferase [Gordonia sp. X0973]QKT07822.1 class I SAM-dependent methyltransferase [Gordonia sp. X0973]
MITTDDVAFLRSRLGVKALENASALELKPDTLIGDVAALRARYGERAPALAETVHCRRRAAGRLVDPQHWLLTDEALQQATASVVAAARAAEIARRFPGAVVHDVTCSVGAELVELAAADGIGAVIGSDLDPVRLAMAAHNVDGATLLRADALTPVSTADVLLADPARRRGGSRTFRIEDLSPPLLDVLTTYAGRPLAVKCAPGLDYGTLRARFGFDGQVQITSLDGWVREACLWTELDDGISQRATVLRTSGGAVRTEEVTDRDPDDTRVGPSGRWIVDPDGAIVRAGLVRHWATRHGLWQLDPKIAYLTGDSIPPGERGFAVLEQVPMKEKALRKALADRDCGSLEILVRGVDVDPDQLRKRLRLKGKAPLALVITRIGSRGVAFVCETGVRAD